MGSESYWRHEQDIRCDVARIMKERHKEGGGYPALVDLTLTDQPIYCPNVFITIAPGEDRVKLHDAISGVYGTHAALGDATGPLCLHIDTLFKKLLLKVLREHFGDIYEWALRVEFQGRGTEHIHLALWCLLLPNYVVEGRTGEVTSPRSSKDWRSYLELGWTCRSALAI